VRRTKLCPTCGKWSVIPHLHYDQRQRDNVCVKPVRSQIRADLEEIYHGRVGIGSMQPWPPGYLELMLAHQGKWIDVDLRCCFEDQWNTVPVEGSLSGLRVNATWISQIDFGDLGRDGWKQKVRDYYAEAWPGREPKFSHVDFIYDKLTLDDNK